MKIADLMHLPLVMASNRQDTIVNSFGVQVAQCSSVDYTGPIIRAANAHDGLLGLAMRYRETVEFYIRIDENNGDEEGANLKRFTLATIDSVLDKVEGNGTVTMSKPQSLGKTDATLGWLTAQFRDRANDDPEEHTEIDAAEVEAAKAAFENMRDLLHRNLEAWDGEEDSVKEEHADLIAELRQFLEGC